MSQEMSQEFRQRQRGMTGAAMTSRVLSLLEQMSTWEPFSSLPPFSESPSAASHPYTNRFLLSDDDDTVVPSVPTASSLAPGSMPQNSFDRELTLLACNFLLYVAMVIILVMICKFYFPDVLIRKYQQDDAESLPSVQRQAPDGASSSNDAAAAATDAAPSAASPAPAPPPAYKRPVPILESGSPDSDSEDDASASHTLLPSSSAIQGASADPISSLRRPAPGQRDHTPMQVEDRSTVMWRLAKCSFGLIFTFCLWGILQERILTRRYPRYTGEYFPYTYFLVFTNRLWSTLFSALLCQGLTLKGFVPVFDPKRKISRTQSIVIYEYTFPSISNMLSSWCQYEALKYVSFPAQCVSKCFKIAPNMAMGKILQDKKYETREYITAIVVGTGMAIFMSTSESFSGDVDVDVDAGSLIRNSKLTGLLLLLMFLVFDSFTSQWQDRMFVKHKRLTEAELLFATNLFSTILSLITLVRAREMQPSLSFLYRHSEMHWHIFLFSIASTAGQVMIFVTIKNFGSLILTILVTARILCSIFISCLLYGHTLSATGFFGILLVMCGVGFSINMKAKGQGGVSKLLNFAPITLKKKDEKSVVKEWSNHLEM